MGRRVSTPTLVSLAVVFYCQFCSAGTKPIGDCAKAADYLVKKTIQANDVVEFTKNVSCFYEVNTPIAPARVTLWNAFESLSGSQQQGSSLGSSGSTNAVSKPSGPTALAEEFGGADVSRGTSSTTVQWSPGKMLTNLALTGTAPLCLGKDSQGHEVPKGCIPPRVLTNLAPLMFKITANTSSGTSSIAGTPTNSTSTGSAQQVDVKSQGISGPNFA